MWGWKEGDWIVCETLNDGDLRVRRLDSTGEHFVSGRFDPIYAEWISGVAVHNEDWDEYSLV